MQNKYIHIISLILLLFVKLSFASCLGVANKIQADIVKYGNSIKSQHLVWMYLPWLKQHLGKIKPEMVNGGTIYQYHWDCHDATGGYVTAGFDSSNKLVKIDGAYSTDDGAGLFLLAWPPQQMPYTQTTLQQTPSQPNAPVSSSCSNVIKQIYLSSNQNANYVWPTLDQMQTLLGTGNPVNATREFLVWGNFMIVVETNGSVISIGEVPAALEKKEITKDNAIQALGNPTKDTVKHLTLYKWNCGNGASKIDGEQNEKGEMSYLGIYIDENNKRHLLVSPSKSDMPI